VRELQEEALAQQFPVRFSRAATNGIELHIAEAGPEDGPLLFLLHGFPEFWYCWRNQISALAESGFHVIAPDQRGYNLSDKPQGINRYHLDDLAADIVGLADRLRREQFSVAGHDWGAGVAWWLAQKYPARVSRLAILNAPHPAVWIHAMRHNPVQRKKSRYVRILQLPWLPEFLVSAGNYNGLAKAFASCSRKDAFSKEDLALYRAAWRQPKAITSMINWYRAILQQPPSLTPEIRITPPCLLTWGKHDAYAEPVLAEESASLCVNPRLEYLEQATHWVQHDEPERVASLLISFFKINEK